MKKECHMISKIQITFFKNQIWTLSSYQSRGIFIFLAWICKKKMTSQCLTLLKCPFQSQSNLLLL